jgi:predicted amidohydrolase
MSRVLLAAAAQLGPVQRGHTRRQVVGRMLDLLRQAHDRGCKLVVFPEMALTTFFPRWFMEEQEEIDSFFEAEMPGPETRPLFEEAARLGMAFYLGYAELAEEPGGLRRYNTAILVDGQGRTVGKYRKVHLPGHAEHEPERPFQHLEKRYFEVGDLGFPVWRMLGGVMGMCLCNDRRWPETYRVMGLQGVEMTLLGYNTPEINGAVREPGHLRMFHHLITMQAGAYQNGTWVVASAKAGREDGVDMMGGSCIVAPTGEVVAMASTLDDELVVARCDLDIGTYIKQTVFNFKKHRRIEHYGLITERAGAVPPPE